MPPLLDTHHHFDFLTGPELRARFLDAIVDAGVRIVAQTLTPSSYLRLIAEPLPPGARAPRWSVGFHPWRIDGDDHVAHELDCFAQALRTTRFVGEIGLDHVPRRLRDVDASRQRRVLRAVLDEVARAASTARADEPYVLSIHAVRSAGEVVELLAEHAEVGRRIVPVLHRFAGTSDELTALIRLGGCLSVHPAMLATKRGRAYAQQVPADRLLLESDLPTQPITSEPQRARATAQALADELRASLVGTLTALSELRGTDMAGVIAANSDRLYGTDSPAVAARP